MLRKSVLAVATTATAIGLAMAGAGTAQADWLCVTNSPMPIYRVSDNAWIYTVPTGSGFRILSWELPEGWVLGHGAGHTQDGLGEASHLSGCYQV
jgi:hypothetical protein